MEIGVAGVVVWYNPSIETTKQNIDSYIDELDELYVIDNSDTPTSEELIIYLDGKRNAKYIPLGENLGIAKALNVGAQEAIKEGYKWLLTMDQDSSATSGMIQRLYEFGESGIVDSIGIVAAQPDTPTRARKIYEGYTFMESVIASGNLVNLKAYEIVGGFVDELFIDYVDCVFSLAIRAHGFVIVQVNDAILRHHLGNITSQIFLGIKMYPTHHNPLRRYYISRNRLYMQNIYKKIFPKFIAQEKRNNLKMWIKTLLYEKNKWEIWRMVVRGRRDFLHGIFGKYQS